MFGAVLWLCWPHLSGSGSPLYETAGDKLVRVDKKKLNPELPASSQRNPFVLRPQAEPELTSPDLPELSDGEGVRGQQQNEPVVDLRKIAESFRLEGTFVSGAKSCALIDGKVYTEGQQVSTSLGPEPCFKLTRVFADRVVCEAGGDEFQIAYAPFAARRDAAEQQEHPRDASHTPLSGDPQAAETRPSDPGAVEGLPGMSEWLHHMERLVRSQLADPAGILPASSLDLLARDVVPSPPWRGSSPATGRPADQ
jgi:hypothetical protein